MKCKFSGVLHWSLSANFFRNKERTVTDTEYHFDGLWSINKLIFLSLIFVLSENIHAQTYEQLYSKLNKIKSENELVVVYYQLGIKYANKPKIDSALFYAEKIKLIGTKQNNKNALARSLIINAITQQLKKEYNESFNTFLKALNLAEHDNRLKADCYYYMARNKFNQEQYSEANSNFMLAKDFYEMENDSVGLYNTYEKLSVSHIITYEIDSAILYIYKAKIIAENLKDSNRIANCNYNLCNYFISIGAYENAKEYALTSVRYSKNVNTLIKRNYYLNLTNCCAYTKQFKEAEANIRIVEQLNDIIKDDWGVIMLNKLKSYIAINSKDFVAAEYYIKQTLIEKSFLHTEPDKLDLQSLFNYAVVLYYQNKIDSAEKYFLKGLDLSNAGHLQLFSMNFSEMLAHLYAENKNYEKANLYLNSYSLLRDSLLNIQKQSVLITKQVEFETEKKQQEIKRLEQEQQIQHLEISRKNQVLNNLKIMDEKKEFELQLFRQKQIAQQANQRIQDATLKNQLLENDKFLIQNKSLQKEKQLQQQVISKQTTIRNAALFAVVLLFLFGAFTYSRYLKRKKLSNKLSQSIIELHATQQQLIQTEREKEAENIRLRISRDIHDDIGHSLTKISLLSDMTANDNQINSPETIETLSRISDYSRNVNSSLSEIVWAISPKHDSLDSLLVYMRNHIHRFFENTGITYQINFPDAYENRSINPELKRNIFLVVKESLNNILKYAKAKNVTIDFKIAGDQFELKIKDDGTGFNPSPSGRSGGVGNGLINMRSRLEQCNGSLQIISSHGNGCEIIAAGTL